MDRDLSYIPRVHRNTLSRSFAGLLSIWLAVCMAEPAQLHTCTMHGGLAIQTSVPGVHANHRAHHEETRPQTGSNRGHHSDSQSRQCSCLGDCSTAGAAVGLPATIVSLEAIAAIRESGPRFDAASSVVSAGNHLLPFANGPPRNSFRA
jgi:hypothetical protein